MKWPLVRRATLEERTAERNEARSALARARDTASATEQMHGTELSRLAMEKRDAKTRAEQWERHATRIAENSERDAVRAEARYADLMASYRTLRQQGFATPPPEPVAAPAEKPDPVLAAINVVARDAKTRAAAMRQVSIDRLAGLEDVEIVQRIHRGNRPAEEIT